MTRSEFDANIWMACKNEKEEAACEMLLSLAQDGMEYPDAEWKVCAKHGIKIARLRELYDLAMA